MDEKTRKYLILLAYRSACALGIFLILFIVGFFAPALTENLSPIWTKNTDFQKLGSLFAEFFKELYPF